MTFAGWGLILGPLSQLPQVFACLDVRSVMFGVTLLNIVLVGGFTPPIQRKKNDASQIASCFSKFAGQTSPKSLVQAPPKYRYTDSRKLTNMAP